LPITEKNKESLPVIQTLWIGEELTTMEKLSMVSFLEQGHPFHLYAYNGIKGVPGNVVVKDANKIIPAEKIFKYRDRDSYAGFANLFRYKLLLEKGGFWVDTDVVCLKPFRFVSDHVFASEYITFQKTKKIMKQVTNCVIKVPAGSKIIAYCYEQAKAKNPGELKWGDTGPKLISNAVLLQFKMLPQVLHPTTFCPVPFQLWKCFTEEIVNKVLAERINRAISGAYAIHLYNEMWRRNNIDKNQSFASKSIYENLKKTYLMDRAV
jgi:mannosyltransferase OCH1-like enzyme